MLRRMCRVTKLDTIKTKELQGQRMQGKFQRKEVEMIMKEDYGTEKGSPREDERKVELEEVMNWTVREQIYEESDNMRRR